MGRFHQFRRFEFTTSSRIFHHEWPLLDRRISFRRLPLRRDPRHSRRAEEYIIGEVGRVARKAAGSRSIILVAENDLQESKMTRPQNEGGDGLDGMWNDDFHHSVIVALTGQTSDISATTPANRRNLFPRRITVFCTRGRRSRGEKFCAALRRSAFPRKRSFVSSKTTIRSRTPARVTDRALKLRPDAIAQSRLFFCSDRGHHCCFKAKNSAHPVLFYFLRTSVMQPSVMGFAKGVLNCWRHFYRLPRRRR